MQRTPWYAFCQYVVLVCCAGGLTIGAWMPANAHDGETQRQQRPARRLLARKPPHELPNILLRTQENTPVRLYDDLVKDRTIMINFMYTTCYDICPGTTGNLMRVHQ